MTVATKLFATRQYHAVRLDDVAASARIGKGTLYVYFKSKEDLFLTLIREGFAQLVESVAEKLNDPKLPSWDRLVVVVDGLVAFATRFPHLFRLMRAGVVPAEDAVLQGHRHELSRLIERAIRRGVRAGEFVDPHPKLTAQFVISFVRGAILYGPRVGRATLRNHLLRILDGGIRVRSAAVRRRKSRGGPA